MDRCLRQKLKEYEQLAAYYGVRKPMVPRAWFVLLIVLVCVVCWGISVAAALVLVKTSSMWVGAVVLSVLSFVWLAILGVIGATTTALTEVQFDLLQSAVGKVEQERGVAAPKDIEWPEGIARVDVILCGTIPAGRVDQLTKTIGAKLSCSILLEPLPAASRVTMRIKVAEVMQHLLKDLIDSSVWFYHGGVDVSVLVTRVDGVDEEADWTKLDMCLQEIWQDRLPSELTEAQRSDAIDAMPEPGITDVIREIRVGMPKMLSLFGL